MTDAEIDEIERLLKSEMTMHQEEDTMRALLDGLRLVAEVRRLRASMRDAGCCGDCGASRYSSALEDIEHCLDGHGNDDAFCVKWTLDRVRRALRND